MSDPLQVVVAGASIALVACLASCGQAQRQHSTFAPGHAALDAIARSMAAAPRVAAASALQGGAIADTAAAEPPAFGDVPGCPSGMARIRGYCIDRYEAYVVEVDADGRESAHSPYTPVDGLEVRAKVAAFVVPQGYISQVQAARACQSAGKRLCSAPEFSLACRGNDEKASYPYGGTRRQRGKCNEGKGSAVSEVFGPGAPFNSLLMNDPRLNRWQGGLAKTGAYLESVSPFGVFDLVGNLHEWGSEVAANGHGSFRGGFYGDAEINGPGCNYVTKAHAAAYHDYSTGFRCCVDVVGD